jgi:hypothetical protein
MTGVSDKAFATMHQAALPGGRTVIVDATGDQGYVMVLDESGADPHWETILSGSQDSPAFRAWVKFAETRPSGPKHLPPSQQETSLGVSEREFVDTPDDNTDVDSDQSDAESDLPVDDRDDPVRYARSHLNRLDLDPDWYSYDVNGTELTIDLEEGLNDDQFSKHQSRLRNSDVWNWDGDEYVNRANIQQLKEALS